MSESKPISLEETLALLKPLAVTACMHRENGLFYAFFNKKARILTFQCPLCSMASKFANKDFEMIGVIIAPKRHTLIEPDKDICGN